MFLRMVSLWKSTLGCNWMNLHLCYSKCSSVYSKVISDTLLPLEIYIFCKLFIHGTGYKYGLQFSDFIPEIPIETLEVYGF